MALRALNSVVAANYSKLSTAPVLAGDLVQVDTSDTSQNPTCVKRYTRASGDTRATIIGVCADDALGTNPSGETPTMINNDPAGSNFVNASTNAFQSFVAGFYVGAKRAIADFKDEGISVVTNLTASVPTYEQRGVSVYTTPSSQFVTDRFKLFISGTGNTADTAAWTPAAGDAVTGSITYPGFLVKYNGTDPIVGRVDYYDSGAGLLYWTLL